MSEEANLQYKRLFKASPGKILVLMPDTFEIIAVTDEYLKATNTLESDIVGKTLFEVFPDNPEDEQADGVKNLSTSLQRAQSLKTPDVMGVQRYPVRIADGSFEERFWTPVNTPVLNDLGNIEFIMHRVEDVTAIVQDSTDLQVAQTLDNDNLIAIQDIILRSRELRQALSKLQEYEARMRTAESLLNLGAWEFNAATGELSWTQQVFDIYDVPATQSAPNFDEYFARIHPDDREASLAVYEEFAQQNQSKIEFEHRVITHDGDIRYVKGVGERHQTVDDDIVVGYVQDITPLVQTRHKLTQAEQLLRLAGEKAHLGGWRVELDSGANTWTPETAVIHDMPPSYSPRGVAEAIDFYAPESRDLVRVSFDECARQGTEFDIICRLQTPKGRRPWVRAIGAAERDQHGNVIAVQGAFQDISTLQEAKFRAEEAERKRLDLLESISDAFYALDKHWNFTYLNHRASALLERSRADLLGNNVWQEFPEAKKGEIGNQYRLAATDQQTRRFQTFYAPLDRWFDVSVYPIPEGLAVYFRDITEGKKQEIELQQAQERFQLISKATNDVIWDWNFSTNKVWWNDSITKVFGYRVSDLEPGPESWSNRIHPDDLERVVHSIHEAIDGTGEYWQDEYRFITHDGQSAHVIDRGFLLRDDAGKATRMVGSMLDITERMDMEERLRESQKLEAVGHLTGGVAHDFNNLLTVILGNSEMLAEVITDPKLRPMAELTLSAAQRGAELTSRLLAFARRQPLAPRPTNLNQLVEAMQSLIRRTLPENIELEFLPDPALGVTEIDASELDTALLNLVVNARDAMQGGGTLTIETANSVLDTDYAERHTEVAPGEYVMVGVSDTGIGMDVDIVHRAFEPFFTTKAVGKGSGLGLSMVFGFTKQSGGHIKIYSEPGEGTTVKLYFPRKQGAQHTSYEKPDELPAQGGTEHILIAEDDDLVQQHLKSQLHSLGYRVTAVRSGLEALEVLKDYRDIDLLLTDIVMPGGMNGRELADRARATYPSLKVLYTSGYTENAIVHHGRLDPGVELLSKPYTRLELANKVRRALNTKEPSL